LGINIFDSCFPRGLARVRPNRRDRSLDGQDPVYGLPHPVFLFPDFWTQGNLAEDHSTERPTMTRQVQSNKRDEHMKLKHQIAAGAALVLLIAGCSQDQPVGADKDASVTGAAKEAREPAQAPALPTTPGAAQPTDKQSATNATNPAPAVPPANNPPGDHP
jgi:hypothetical protein